MKKTNLYIIAAFLLVIAGAFLIFTPKVQKVNCKGFLFSSSDKTLISTDKNADISIEYNFRDKNMNNDTINITLPDVHISEHILLSHMDSSALSGSIVHLDDTTGDDSIIGKFLYDYTNEIWMIHLSQENIDIITSNDAAAAEKVYSEDFISKLSYK